MLTPHIAGSVGRECWRLAHYMIEELERYVRGEPMRWVVTPLLAEHSSHQPLVTTPRRERRLWVNSAPPSQIVSK